MKPAWPGPIEGGITQSLISRMLECPYRAFVYYGLGLQEPSILEPNLIWGNAFHLGLELLLGKPKRIRDLTPEEFAEVAEAVKTYLKTHYPGAPATYPYTVANMLKLYDDSYKDTYGDGWTTEHKFKIPYTTRRGRLVTVKGKADGLKSPILVEHKCKGKIDPAQTRVETPFDMQSLLYCHVLDCNHVIYDLIRIPEAQWKLPYRNPLCKAHAYADIMFTGSDCDDFPINLKRQLWLNQITLDIPDDRIDNFLAFQFDPLVERVCALYDLWCEDSFDPEDPNCYGPLFYRTPVRQFDATRTERYKCSFHSLITEQLGFNELTPVTSFYPELENA